MSNEIVITYPSGKVASQVVDLLVRKKPIGWGRKSYPTYYKEAYALQLKRELDIMLVDKQPKIFRLDRMPSLSMNSIYLWTNQAFHYIIDNMDNEPGKEGQYRKMWSEIKTFRVPRVGVQIEYQNFAVDVLIGERVTKGDDRMKWRRDMDAWLEDDDMKKPFHKDGLILSPEQIQGIKDELGDLGNVQFSVTSREVKIIKTL